MNLSLKLMIFLLFVLGSHACLALDLDTAKSQGLVGEQTDGYLGIVIPSPEVEYLTTQINQQRREAYARIAKKNGISVDKVGRLAARKLFEKAAASEYFEKPDGGWVQKSQVDH